MATIGVFAIIHDEQGGVLCVKQNYPPHEWTLPGGRVEPNESPLAALHREVFEETGQRIAIERFIGTYAMPYKNDLTLLFAGRTIARDDWRPNGEIAELGYFVSASLPQPMNARHRLRIADAIGGHSGVVRVFDAPDRLGDALAPT
ncbi:MAG: NUDIX hydrolase [Dongiaceae bacterium]